MSYSGSPAFHDAAAYLSTAPSLAKVSNDAKLELYGLFKYLTIAPSPNTPRPSLFDFTGRAKWDAWAKAGQSYNDGAAAEERYKTVAEQLGWKEGAAPVPPSSVEGASEESVEGIWDKEGSKPKGGGMGTAVSTMKAPSPEEGEGPTLHSLALANDREAVSAFLAERPSSNINEPDEYGYTPLHLACDRGNAAVVQVLLSRGADPAVKDPDDMTALQLAEVAGHADIVSLLQ